MAGADRGYVGTAAEGSGKKISNQVVQVLQPDGTVATVYQQLISVADADGTILEFGDPVWQLQMLETLQSIERLLARLANVPVGAL